MPRLAMSAFIRAAEAEGLVTCPISAVREPVEEISAMLELPERVFLSQAGLCIGYTLTGNLGSVYARRRA